MNIIARKQVVLIKKYFIAVAAMLFILVLAYYITTAPLPFAKAANLDFEVHSINLANGVNNTPGIKITDRETVSKVLQLLNLYQFRKEYHNPLQPRGGGGSLFKLGLTDKSEKQRIFMCFNGSHLTINGKEYIAAHDISWTIAAYLMMKNLDQKPKLSLIKIAHENLNNMSKRYGEPKPFIVEIKPGITKISGPRTMYAVHLKGNFKKGTLEAGNLYFSMQELYPVFWDIKATDSSNKIIWEEKR